VDANHDVTEPQREEREHISVAAQRPSKTARPQPTPRRAHVASEAGLALIVVIALFATAGGVVGSAMAGVPVAGALVGGFVGVIAGFTAVYLCYRDL
jgi:hypothetical protein